MLYIPPLLVFFRLVRGLCAQYQIFATLPLRRHGNSGDGIVVVFSPPVILVIAVGYFKVGVTELSLLRRSRSQVYRPSGRVVGDFAEAALV